MLTTDGTVQVVDVKLVEVDRQLLSMGLAAGGAPQLCGYRGSVKEQQLFRVTQITSHHRAGVSAGRNWQ